MNKYFSQKQIIIFFFIFQSYIKTPTEEIAGASS
jgi:hypothetical protein